MKKKNGCYFVPQGGLDEERSKQIGLMIAYMATVKGGNKELAGNICRRAKKMGFTIKPCQSLAD